MRGQASLKSQKNRPPKGGILRSALNIPWSLLARGVTGDSCHFVASSVTARARDYALRSTSRVLCGYFMLYFNPLASNKGIKGPMGSRERPAEAKTEVEAAIVRRVAVAISDAEVTRAVAPTPATTHAPRGALPTCRF